MSATEAGLLTVALVELVKRLIRAYVPDTPDVWWVVASICFAVGLTFGSHGVSWESFLAGLRLGLTVAGLYAVATAMIHRLSGRSSGV